MTSTYQNHHCAAFERKNSVEMFESPPKVSTTSPKGSCSLLLSFFGFLSLFSGVINQACLTKPTFSVVGFSAATDTTANTAAVTDPITISTKFEMTGYFTIDAASTYTCSQQMGNPPSGGVVPYSVVTSLSFTNGSYIAFALKPGTTAGTYDAILVQKYALYTLMTTMGTLDGNAGFFHLCRICLISRRRPDYECPNHHDLQDEY